ncbi:unnamed protein product [Nesidiocoris tenuis]|uniref:Uncharacterized protein n=1 Tax=Nesidiocoris tenuis TaxID=355587 RepID=A0A6H5GXN7_9HEMI|nr:unnamed protein product [Nesidiocoris tenuis]
MLIKQRLQQKQQQQYIKPQMSTTRSTTTKTISYILISGLISVSVRASLLLPTDLLGQSLFNITSLEDHDELKKNLSPSEADDVSPSRPSTSSGKEIAKSKRAERRSFYLRLRHKSTPRGEQPQYETVHVMGHLRVPSPPPSSSSKKRSPSGIYNLRDFFNFFPQRTSSTNSYGKGPASWSPRCPSCPWSFNNAVIHQLSVSCLIIFLLKTHSFARKGDKKAQGRVSMRRNDLSYARNREVFEAAN